MEQNIVSREEQRKTEAIDKQSRIRLRLIPIWLRIILFVLIVALSALCGAIVGFSVMGDGNLSQVFEKETWTHIRDLVNKDV
ncbi:MAG: DNA-directed RNA polymerase subunit beta [Bacillus sp. (in: firmicutes)]